MIELKDPVFGAITYEQGVWTFLPKKLEDGYMIGIVAEEAGPSAQQRDLFTRLRSNLNDYERRANEYMASHEDCSANISQLRIYSVQIHDDAATRCGEFTLEFSDEDAFVIHRVLFRCEQPVEYGFDD